MVIIPEILRVQTFDCLPSGSSLRVSLLMLPSSWGGPCTFSSVGALAMLLISTVGARKEENGIYERY